MSDKKISELTSATAPLAGTEVVPLVQSGVTKKVAVSNLTAGRAVSAMSLSATQGYQFRGADDTMYELMRVVGGSNNPGVYAKAVQSSTEAYVMSSSSTGGDNLCLGPSSMSGKTIALKNDGKAHLYGDIVMATAAKGVNFTANTPAAGMTSQLLNWYEEGTWTPTISSATYTYTTQSGKYIRVGKLVHVTFFIQVSNASAQAGTPATIDGLPFNCAQDYAAASFSYWNDIIGTTAINGLTASGATSIQLRTPVTNANPTIIVGTQMTSSSAIAGSLTYICS